MRCRRCATCWPTTMPAGLQGNVTGQAGIGADYLDAAMEATDRTTVVTVILVVVILLDHLPGPARRPGPAPHHRHRLGGGPRASWDGWPRPAGRSLRCSTPSWWSWCSGWAPTTRSSSSHGSGRNWPTTSGPGRRGGRVGRIGGVITASAATVIVGLSSMAVARFGMIRSVGPALAVAIGVTVLAGLTLTPAYLGLFGRFLFWPFHRRVRAHDGEARALGGPGARHHPPPGAGHRRPGRGPGRCRPWPCPRCAPTSTCSGNCPRPATAASATPWWRSTSTRASCRR